MHKPTTEFRITTGIFVVVEACSLILSLVLKPNSLIFISVSVAFLFAYLVAVRFQLDKLLPKAIDYKMNFLTEKDFYNVGSIMKCNTLESERDFVILRMYAQKIPTSWTEGTGGDREYA